ncbi:hypothetical protein ACPA54_36410 [Uniformispora flossi]|uniref:hypothetical protein n=1 Tax=Uniformispora flossi TaxID=3390723 RepID=UPI003C2E1EF4
MAESARSRGVPAGNALLLAAGLADLALDRLGAVLERGRAVLGRADLGALADDGHGELRSRGRVVLDRFAAPPAYLELIARHVTARDDG